MNISEAMQGILSVFPNATIGEDNDGQIVIYTDVRLVRGGTLVPFANE